MNARKANLKKLRLPNTESSNLRNVRKKATATISKFFPPEQNAMELPNTETMPSPIEKLETCENLELMPSPIAKLEEEEPATKPKRSTRTKLSTFLPKEKRMKPTVERPISNFLTKGKADDFETPDKNVKKAPKAKAKPRPKRQQKIKSALLKHEEFFSAVTTQHCLVDNINPDEMQMALALSRSEADISGAIVLNDEEGKEEKENIRDKLKKFGFRVGDPEDYTLTAFVPTNRKTKWANKFTALTLRNPERQLEKVNRRVDEFLSTQFVSPGLTHADEKWSYCVKSETLLPLVNRDDIIILPDVDERMAVVDFYVLSLFEPSSAKPGHLLKDVRHIAGRDISPTKTKSPLKGDVELDSHLQSPAIKKSRYDEISNRGGLSLPCSSADSKSPEMSYQPLQQLPATISGITNYNSEIETPYPRKVAAPNQVDNVPASDSVNGVMSSNNCDSPEPRHEWSSIAITSLSNGTTFKSLSVTNETSISSMPQTMPNPLTSIEQLSSTRATSPDIFADSDVEMERVDCNEMEKLNVSESSSSSQQITTYEIFSSDEVKTSLDTKNDSNDVNHNSLTAVIDLTQCESNTNSQQSDKIVSSIPIQSYQENSSFDDLPTTSLMISSKFDEIASTSLKSSKGTDYHFNFNGNHSSDKSTKRTCFSFDSSASEELHKSASFNKSYSMQTDNSIDLTQTSDDDGELIVLSDDEINYSIRKTDKSLHIKEEELCQNLTIDYFLNGKSENEYEEKREFSFVDLVADTQPLVTTQSEEFDFDLKTKSNTSLDSLDLDLSKRSDFGILEEQSPFKTPTKTPKKTPRKTPTSASPKCRKALSESFLSSPVENVAYLKHFSSAKKFSEFTKSDDDSLTDLDEIDKLIYGSPSKKIYKKPAGLDQLLTGAINAKVDSPKKTKVESPKEFHFNGRTYLVRTTDVSQKPNFETMNESSLLDQLYKYGIKPLKRKQAVKILEYVYNQTHPCLVDDAVIASQTVMVNGDDNEISEDQESMAPTSESKFNLKDSWGHVMLSDMNISMEIEDEQYILQTNTSKKISTALLPFHIAWYNLVKSNKLLHEAILHYEPIDLQEIYLFFKGLGYRYDPKELKYFFDSRSIIFRYDLNKSDPSAGSNRHVRKKQLKFTQRNGKNKIS